jgi:hypothetical protein
MNMDSRMMVGWRLVAALVAGCGMGVCGSYGPQGFASYSQGTTNLNDGTVISSNNGICQVRENTPSARYLRLTQSGVQNTSSSFKLPDLDVGKAVRQIQISFNLRISHTNSNPADGVSVNFGGIPAGDGGGEAGFAMDEGLTIAWDTYDNGGDPRSVEVFADGVSVGNFPFSSLSFNPISTTYRQVTVFWDENGLDLSYGGVVLATNLATPGFLPKIGDRCAFSARTGGATQDSRMDDLTVTTVAVTPIETGGPVITEFMADNDETLEDEDVTAVDWIEIYNGQATPVNLAGYYLTDTSANLGLWQFPAVTVPAYGYVVVFASAKNRVDPGGQLHTNFALAKAGGYLALVAPNGTTVLSEFSYGLQATDVSYGEKGEGRTLGYLETPTPGGLNGGLQAAGGPAEEVVFDRAGGVFSGSTTLTILPPVAVGAVVRYTTNNTVPVESSPVFNGTPFGVSATTTVRARVFESGKLPGPVKTVTLLKLGSDLAGFNSALPIMVAESFGVDIDLASDPNSARPFRQVYTVLIDRDPVDGLARMTGVPDFAGRSAMHVRGQSSSGFPKKPYAWEAWDENNEDEKVTILDFPRESDWVLHAPYSDKTLMRNEVVYGCARELNGTSGGMRTRYVELFLNPDGGEITMADYRGVYLIVEKIKRDPERVDVAKLNLQVTAPDLVTGGYIFKKDKPPYSQPWTTATEGIPLDVHDPDSLNATQAAYLTGYVNSFESALHGAGFANPETGYAAYIDVRSFIDNHLSVELFKNIDGYRISQYFHKDRGGKIRALPVWDYNLALGNANYLQGEFPSGWYYSNPELLATDYFWYERLFQDPEFVLAYWDRFWELRRGVFSNVQLMARIDAADAELDAPNGSGVSAVTRNFNKWQTLGGYVWPNAGGSETRTTHQSEVDWMKSWLTSRMSWVESQSLGIGGAARPPTWGQYGGEVGAGYGLTMTNPNGWSGAQIRYTTDGSDPRGGTAQVYAGPVVISQSVEIRARVTDGSRWSPLTQGIFVVNTVPASAGNLVVSEVHYHTPDPSAEEVGAGFLTDREFEYLELMNVHPTAAVDLTGVAFTNGITFSFDTAVPLSKRVVPPGGSVVIVANAAGFDFRYGSGGAVVAGVYGGSLDNSGERIGLVDGGGVVIRNFVYDDVPPWPVAADGGGVSLVLVSPGSLPDHADALNWRGSFGVGGTPGGVDTLAFPADPDGDVDGDGVSAMLEVAMGSSDGDAGSRVVPGLSREMMDVGGGVEEFVVFEFRVNRAAEWARFRIEAAEDLAGWGDATGEFVHLETVGEGGGVERRRYRSVVPLEEMVGERRFYRLAVTREN